jgi:hypothetical protein
MHARTHTHTHTHTQVHTESILRQYPLNYFEYGFRVALATEAGNPVRR